MKHPIDPLTGRWYTTKEARDFVRLNGNGLTTEPPRNLVAQSGARKILVTWDAPANGVGVIGYKIYKDSEASLFDTINDTNVRQYSMPASSGSTPPTVNIFVSAFSRSGESTKMQIQGTAIAEAGAPADPSPPAGSAAGGTGGDFGFDGGDDAGFTRGN